MTQTMTVRLPDDIHEDIRREAFDTRLSMNQIIAERLSIKLNPEVYGQLCALFEAAWHHAVPSSLDDLPLVTSTEARKLANLATEALGL